MAIKNMLFIFIIGVIGFLAAPLSLSAQSSGWYIDRRSDGTRFIQRLAWTGGEHALRYEVIIQRLEGEYASDYYRAFTENHFIEVSLHPGNYRFQVITYDVLNRPGDTSEWKFFRVRQAMEPEILEIIPVYSPKKKDMPAGFILYVSGNDIFREAGYAIRFPCDVTIVPTVLDAGDGSRSVLFFEEENLFSLEFELIVRNPGGMEGTAKGVIELDEVKQATLINFGIAWQPLFSFYGEFPDGVFYPLGVKARINALFRAPLNFYAGPEFALSWARAEEPGETPHMFYAGVNLVIMKWLYDYKLGFGYRLGAAYHIAPEDYRRFFVNMGVSAHWRMADIFLLEAGIDYSHLFGERPAGHFRPFIGAGVVINSLGN
jgi:hypothetical protein